MEYIALYRKYRPQNLSEVVGQTAIKQALTNAFEQNRLVHAYLFSGPRGTGKTSIAKIFAKTINCSAKPDPAHACNQCSNCREITSGTCMDVFEIDAASNRGIDQIRDLRENVKYAPGTCAYKVYIIDEAHMLTTEAFNALLKTLEEPPAHVVFILATTETNKIPITIQSRCQRFDFRKLSLTELLERIDFVAADSDIEIEPEAADMIAVEADGALRDALSLLEQANIVESPITTDSLRLMLGTLHKEDLRRILKALSQKDLPTALVILSNLFAQGKEARLIVQEMIGYLRMLIIYKAYPESPALAAADDVQHLQEIAKGYSNGLLIHTVEVLAQALQDMRSLGSQSLAAELALIKLCQQSLQVAQPVIQPSVSSSQQQTEYYKSQQRSAPVRRREQDASEPLREVNEKNILQILIEQLNKDRNRTVSACISSGLAEVHTYSAEQLTLSVNKTFALQRITAGDYQKIVEDTLWKIAGHEMRFLAISEEQAALQKTARKKTEQLIPINEAQIETLDDSVKQAHQMFGGTVNIVQKT